MGIRFFCPNGHKLNVKEFQAGRTGICPFCGEKMQIPLRKHASKLEAGAGFCRRRGAATSCRVSELPEAEPQRPIVAGACQRRRRRVRCGESALPIRWPRAGEVVWYVRPASGGQFGPAGARRHAGVACRGTHRRRLARLARRLARLADGRRRVSATFAQPADPGRLEAVVPNLVVAPVHPHPVAPPSSHAGSEHANGRLIGSLVLVVVVLFIILLVVLLNK